MFDPFIATLILQIPTEYWYEYTQKKEYYFMKSLISIMTQPNTCIKH